MDIKSFEDKINRDIVNIVESIIRDNIILPIQANARAGAEISDFLEKKFVDYANKYSFLKNSEYSPKGATKNPWDAKTTYIYGEIEEVIWIDFKALKVSSADSNPDIGSPNKIIEFIKSGNFYLLYIYVYYDVEENFVKFVQNPNNFSYYTKSYFLKDVSSTVRRNPKNQLQVNAGENSFYRTREDFIDLLIEKIRESHKRQIEISELVLTKIDQISTKLHDANKQSFDILNKKISALMKLEQITTELESQEINALVKEVKTLSN
jgi:hypothetical protein